MKQPNLWGFHTNDSAQFSNTADVEVRWNTVLLGWVDHNEIELSRLVLGADGYKILPPKEQLTLNLIC